jgi:adenylate kinase
MIIAVSGTPGTGKTKLSKRLATALKYKYLDVKKLIAEKKLDSGYDRKRKCQVIDTRKLNSVLIRIIKDNPNLVIDSHLSHFLPKNYVHRCIITTCELDELRKRLEERDYSEEKVGENLEAEIFETCLTEAEEAGHKVMTVDTTKNYKIESVIKVLGAKPR